MILKKQQAKRKKIYKATRKGDVYTLQYKKGVTVNNSAMIFTVAHNLPSLTLFIQVLAKYRKK